MQCPQCKYEILDKALFCPQCGHRLPQPMRSPAQAAPEVPPEPFATWPEDAPAPRAPRPPRSPRQSWGLSLAVIGVAMAVMLALAGLGVAAVYYGLQDRTENEKQVAAEHYQKGLAQMEAGQWELAVAEFELVLKLDPENSAANAALAEARQQLEIQPTATPMLQQETVAAYFTALKEAYDRGNWAEAIEHGERLANLDPDYEQDQVDDMMFEALYQQGLELVQQERMGEAVRFFDRALALRPDDEQVEREMDLASLYLTAMGYWGADWAKTTASLGELYAEAPNYADVTVRTYEAYVSYGNVLLAEDPCLAAQQYGLALEMRPSSDVKAQQSEALELCAAGPTATPEGTPSPWGQRPDAPSGTYAGWVVEQTEAGADKIFFRGRVLDEEGNGVPNIRVQIQAWDWSAMATTDGAGQYSFDGLNEPTDYTLTLPDVTSIAVVAPGEVGQTTWVNFQLVE